MVQFKKDPIQGLKRIFPSDCSDCGDERALWDSIAQEGARLSGTRILFYSLRRAMNRHPLYKEPSQGGKEWSFHGPFEMWAALQFAQADEIQPEATEYGQHTVSDAMIYVARKEFEDASAPEPKLGDIVEVWSKGVGGSPFAEEELFAQWDVVQANPDGNIFSSEAFVQYVLRLKQRTKFVALRKTENTQI